MRGRPPKLPKLLDRKIYKTGQTRGADDDVIYQNRVSRNSTVLIPYLLWEQGAAPPPGEENFANGFITLVPPLHYFGTVNIDAELEMRGLEIGVNALVFYQTRTEWNVNNPENLGWEPAENRISPLGGQYVARIAATTALDNGEKIIRGFTTSKVKGAGIRLFEYAGEKDIRACRLQLEALFWMCRDSTEVAIINGMTAQDALSRSTYNAAECQKYDLLDLNRLHEARIINTDGRTICPLCLEELSGEGFLSRLEQAEGREVHDLTVTKLNLFHISELRFGVYNHKPYNLGWGHHHCNVVVKDSGIIETLQWMYEVVHRNINDGHFAPENNPN
uniref:PflMI n=1 Tax=Pseudomonas fluorescens TaxID=294 RepID=F1KM53_PSEFL|nr:PflMI [Pseudomonas fluorescens]